MRRWAKIVVAVVVLVVAALAAIPFFVNANTFRPLLETELSAALGRQVKLGNLKLSVFRGSLVADTLSIADDPGYSTTPFLSAREVRIGVNMQPLIRSRQIQIRSFEIEAPQIHLVRGANGLWNFSSLSHNEASFASNPAYSEALAHSSVGLIAIRDGRAVVESLPAQGQPLVYDHLDLTVRRFSMERQFPFTLDAAVPGGGLIHVKGNVGPIDPQNAAQTAMNVAIRVRHLDPVQAGFLDADVGISVLADIDADAKSDGKTVSSTGTAHLQRLQLVPAGSPASQPIDLSYDISHNLEQSAGRLQHAALHLGKGTFDLSGDYRLAGGNPWVDLKVNGQSVPIDELQPLMAAAGVKLPNGSQLKGGTLTVGLEMTGPAKDLVVTGPVEVDNTQLTGFDLGSKISGIAALAHVKTGSTTQIQSLKLNLHASNAGIQVDQIDSVLPALGESTGSGTISPKGALAFRLVAHVANAHGMGKVGAGLLAKLNKFSSSSPNSSSSSLADKQSADGVPILVGGTASDPVITADVTGLLHRNATTLLDKAKQNSPKSLFKRLFGRKGPTSAEKSPSPAGPR